MKNVRSAHPHPPSLRRPPFSLWPGAKAVRLCLPPEPPEAGGRCAWPRSHNRFPARNRRNAFVQRGWRGGGRRQADAISRGKGCEGREPGERPSGKAGVGLSRFQAGRHRITLPAGMDDGLLFVVRRERCAMRFPNGASCPPSEEWPQRWRVREPREGPTLSPQAGGIGGTLSGVWWRAPEGRRPSSINEAVPCPPGSATPKFISEGGMGFAPW